MKRGALRADNARPPLYRYTQKIPAPKRKPGPFLVSFNGVDRGDDCPAEGPLFQFRHAADRRAAGRADAVLQYAGVQAALQIEHAGADEHLRGHLIGRRAGQAVFDARVTEAARYIAVNAGVQPPSVPARAIRAAVTGTIRAILPNVSSNCAYSASVRLCVDSQARTPSPMAMGVFGMVLMWCVPGARKAS